MKDNLDAHTEEIATVTVAQNRTYPIEQIAFDLVDVRQQIRKEFEPESLKQLGDSILQHGLVEPIVVKPNGAGGYELIAGERRLRAARDAGLKGLPTIIRHDLQGQDTTVLQAIENLQRQDLTLPEECAAVSIMVDAMGFDDTCKKLSKSAAWVSKRSTMRTLVQEVKDLLVKGSLRDLELAHDLSALYQIKPKDGADAIKRIENQSKKKPDEYVRAPMTREEVRRSLRWAKEEVQRKAKEKLERDKAKKDPKAIKESESLRKQAAREKAKADALKDIEVQAKALTDQAMHALMPALGYNKAVKRDHHGYSHTLPFRVREQSFHRHMHTIPKTREEAKFYFDTDAPIDQIEKLQLILGVPLKLTLQHLDLSLEEALKISAILGKRAEFESETELTGSQLQSAIARASKPNNPNITGKAGKVDVKVATFIKECIVKSAIGDRLNREDAIDAYFDWAQKRGADLKSAGAPKDFDAAFLDAKIGHLKSAGVIKFLAVKLKVTK